ncbi:hypothetical protein JZ751_010392 [Albula glossodonta]|uniref:Uncharacterized protein n=1 Tax=Albula glossodonta TaxID=121402 RepID=A0A8T2NWH3_9TELE|nr:hypothetical protein JZ751_010392 [Albula glossodonta]
MFPESPHSACHDALTGLLSGPQQAEPLRWRGGMAGGCGVLSTQAVLKESYALQAVLIQWGWGVGGGGSQGSAYTNGRESDCRLLSAVKYLCSPHAGGIFECLRTIRGNTKSSFQKPDTVFVKEFSRRKSEEYEIALLGLDSVMYAQSVDRMASLFLRLCNVCPACCQEGAPITGPGSRWLNHKSCSLPTSTPSKCRERVIDQVPTAPWSPAQEGLLRNKRPPLSAESLLIASLPPTINRFHSLFTHLWSIRGERQQNAFLPSDILKLTILNAARRDLGLVGPRTSVLLFKAAGMSPSRLIYGTICYGLGSCQGAARHCGVAATTSPARWDNRPLRSGTTPTPPPRPSGSDIMKWAQQKLTSSLMPWQSLPACPSSLII